MSFCEFHPEYQKHLKNNFDENQNIPFPNLQEELQWGLSYRNLKKKEVNNKLIPPKKSPIDIPFKICREQERKRKAEKGAKDQKKPMTASKGSRKLSLLEKSVLSQDKYMEYLSTPNPKYEEPPAKRRKKKCVMEPCSPRLVLLATPNKRRVYANWKDFYERLPTEMIMRFEQILYTNNCLEPRDARYYYKKLDKEKRKKSKAKKSRKTKKRKEEEKIEQKWIKDQIEKTVKAILHFTKEQPLFVLNYKQLLLSDSILNQVAKKGVFKKPKRNTKKPFRSTVIDISDKLALWVDTLIRFVDVQVIESEEDIPPLTISSIEISSEEEEGSSEEGEEESLDEDEGSSEDEGEWSSGDYGKGGKDGKVGKSGKGGTGGKGGKGGKGSKSGKGDKDGKGGIGGVGVMSGVGKGGYYEGEDLSVEDEEWISGVEGVEPSSDEKGETDFELGEEYGEAGLEDFLADLNGDQLEKLIKILSNCSDDFLETSIDPDNLPEVTYKDILEKLIELKEKLNQQPGQSFLEQLMIDWAMKNEPDKVDAKLLQKIKEAAAIIEESLMKQKEISKDAPMGKRILFTPFFFV